MLYTLWHVYYTKIYKKILLLAFHTFSTFLFSLYFSHETRIRFKEKFPCYWSCFVSTAAWLKDFPKQPWKVFQFSLKEFPIFLEIFSNFHCKLNLLLKFMRNFMKAQKSAEMSLKMLWKTWKLFTWVITAFCILVTQHNKKALKKLKLLKEEENKQLRKTYTQQKTVNYKSWC